MRSLIGGLAGSRFLGKLNVRPTVTWRAEVGALIVLAMLSSVAQAQTFTTLYSFSGLSGDGMYPNGALTLNGSTLYGTTSEWGIACEGPGTVFSIPVSGGTPTTLLSFNGTNGSVPLGGLTLSGTILYGMTDQGGAYGNGGGGSGFGTIFSIPVGGGTPTTLFNFDGTNGVNPAGSLTLSPNGSTLYGMAVFGGANNKGTIFSIPVGGGTPTTLFNFNATSGTATSQGSLTLSPNGSTLYGMTYNGGANNKGTIFSIPVGGGTPTTLFNFDGTNGAYPCGSVTLSPDGSTLYGIANEGGANSNGTVFSISVTGGTPTTLFNFSGNNGQGPTGDLTLSGSTLYGTTGDGGANNKGSIFSIPVSGGTPTTLFNFSGNNGQVPTGDLTLSLNGSTLYGMTNIGGANSKGTVFALNIAPAKIGLSNVLNATIISGGTATLGMTVSNSPTSGYNLNYTLSRTVQSGSATLGTITSGTGILAPSASQSCTVSASSTNLGINTISFTASDPNSSNSSQTTNATLTVLDHSNASLSSTANQTTQTINFGNVLRGATVPSQSFTIYNRAANTTAAYTANLKLTGSTATGDAALTTNLSTFSGLTADNGNTYTASLNTSNYTTTGSGMVSVAAFQLVDDSTLSGSGNNNNGAISIVLQGNVGNATADKSNSVTSFGTPLTAPVAQNASYANLESKATATTGNGGYGMVGSTATILAGTNSSGSAANSQYVVANPDAGGTNKPRACQRHCAIERHGARAATKPAPSSCR